MNILAEKLEEIQAALEIGQIAITELHKENGELKEKLQAFEMLESQDIDKELQRLAQENRALKDNPKASANWQMVLSAVNANRKANELETDRDEWKRRALEAEEAGRAILEWEGSNCDGYADKVSDDCPFCKMRAVLNSINSGNSATDIDSE